MLAPPQLWMRLSGALQKKRGSELSYREIVKNSSNDETIAAKQVRPGQCGAPFGKRFLPRNCVDLQDGSGLPGVTRTRPWQGWRERAWQPCGSHGQSFHPQTYCQNKLAPSWVLCRQQRELSKGSPNLSAY